jgi:hypothetical protein
MNQLQGFSAQKGSNSLRYPETNLPYELRQIMFVILYFDHFTAPEQRHSLE